MPVFHSQSPGQPLESLAGNISFFFMMKQKQSCFFKKAILISAKLLRAHQFCLACINLTTFFSCSLYLPLILRPGVACVGREATADMICSFTDHPSGHLKMHL